jgi:hypothetical protein
MMFYSNTVTKRLEGRARARGMAFGIVICPDNSVGRFFVVNQDQRPLTNWWTLGWTKTEAEACIDSLGSRRE